MFKSYLKLAWRNFFANKTFSIINLLGLTGGITCTIFIFLWVTDELSYDQFHANHKNIYMIMANRDFKNNVFTDQNMVFPLAYALQTGQPQIKRSVVTSHREGHVLSLGEKKLKKEGYLVGGDYFGMFSWRFLKGSASTVFRDPQSIVLTQSAATAFFGKSDPINKVLKIDNNENVRVTAVLANPPGNSTLQFDFLRPFNLGDPASKRNMEEWGNSSWNVFVEADPKANVSQLSQSVNKVMHEHNSGDKVSSYFAFPLDNLRLHGEFKDGKVVGGMIDYVRLFSLIAVIILMIACINFMNLSTARSQKRAKEVGIRKTLGSNRNQLVKQFFAESLLLTAISFLLSLLIVFILMPAFNSLVGKDLSLDLSRPVFWYGATVIVVFTSFVAGSYPALFLSSFNPIKVLKGTLFTGRASSIPRQVLVIGQFVTAILLISATVIVYQQLQHLQNRSIGYNPNNLVMVPPSPDVTKSYPAIKQELLKTGTVAAVTRTSSPMTEIWWRQTSPDYPGRPEGSTLIFSAMLADVDFAKTTGIGLLMGHDFTGTPGDTASVLLNKTAVKAMGIKEPIGLTVSFPGNGKFRVIGVIPDVIMGSPYEAVDPMIVFYNAGNSSFVDIRLNDGVAPQQALAEIQKVFDKFNPAFPFEYRFADQEFSKKMATEQLISKLTNIFAGLAIFICCIGLIGLASFTIEKRIREIGLRKVLGATVRQLLLLISKEFLKLAFIALVIAVPFTWWLMNNWLNRYLYHISINGALFGVVAGVILSLTLVVVSLATTRAAMTNPVKNLKRE